jgi:hypothetical protein
LCAPFDPRLRPEFCAPAAHPRLPALTVNHSSTLPTECCSRPVLPNIGEDAGSPSGDGMPLAADRRQPFVNRAAIRSWQRPAPCAVRRLPAGTHTLSRPATGSVAPRKVSCGFQPGI